MLEPEQTGTELKRERSNTDTDVVDDPVDDGTQRAEYISIPDSGTTRPPKKHKTNDDKLSRTSHYLLTHLGQREQLSELHTHLLGMGNASFWVDAILMDRRKLPTQSDFGMKNVNASSKDSESDNDDERDESQSRRLREELGPMVWDKTSEKWFNRQDTASFFDYLRDNSDHIHVVPSKYVRFSAFLDAKFIRELNHRNLSFAANFCYDVVILLDHLAKSFGVYDSTHDDLIQARVEEKLGLNQFDHSSDGLLYFRHYIIFHAREQNFQVVYGITVRDLRAVVGGNVRSELLSERERNARSHLINAFSMCNADGTEPRSIDFHSFRGAFTPQFYPRRFAIKDSLYGQRLDLLAYCLLHALQRYSSCSPPVTYCEFSMGCSDISRPWVLDVLRSFPIVPTEDVPRSSSVDLAVCILRRSPEMESNSFAAIISGFPWLKPCPHDQPNVVYKFLVGFNRQDVTIMSQLIEPSNAVNFLYEYPQLAIHYTLKEIKKSQTNAESDLFVESEKLLSKLKKSINVKYFYKWVVGLDLFGDEMGYPYCPFITAKFLEFIRTAHRHHNPHFGVRIHAGENVLVIDKRLPGYRLYAAHMYITYRCIEYLHGQLNVTRDNRRIRIGHGVAFASIMQTVSDSVRHTPSRVRKSDVLLAEIKTCASHIFKDIAFEVNLTSNYYLLGSAVRGHADGMAIRMLLEQKIPVILSTDDDGIWPIDSCPFKHRAHHSLAAEYCKAITLGLVTSIQEINDMIKNSEQYSFTGDEPSSTQPSQPPISISQTTINTSEYAQTIIIHPTLIHFMLDRFDKKEVTAGSFYTKYRRIYPSSIPITTSSLSDELNGYALIALAVLYHCSSFALTKFSEECVVFDTLAVGKIVFDQCREIYTMLIDKSFHFGANYLMQSSEQDYFFCSAPMMTDVFFGDDFIHNYPHIDANYYLEHLSTQINDYIRDKNTDAVTTILGFCPRVSTMPSDERGCLNLENPVNDTITQLRDNASQLQAGSCIFVHSNSTKKYYRDIECTSGVAISLNAQRNVYTDADSNSNTQLFYVVCPHSSAATAALHLLAKNPPPVTDVDHITYLPFEEFFIPYLPMCIKFVRQRQSSDNTSHDDPPSAGTQTSTSRSLARVPLTLAGLKKSFLLHYEISAACDWVATLEVRPCAPKEQPTFDISLEYVALRDDIDHSRQFSADQVILHTVAHDVDEMLFEQLLHLISNLIYPKIYVTIKATVDRIRLINSITNPLVKIVQNNDVSDQTNNSFIICTRVELIRPGEFDALQYIQKWIGGTTYEFNSDSVKVVCKSREAISRYSTTNANGFIWTYVWEQFVVSLFERAGSTAWTYSSIRKWCDVVEAAFQTDEDIHAFANFIRLHNRSPQIRVILTDSSNYRLANDWQVKKTRVATKLIVDKIIGRL